MWKFTIFEKLGWEVAVKEVIFCSFGVDLVRINFLSFSTKFSFQEISSNFKKKFEKCWNWCQKNFIFLRLEYDRIFVEFEWKVNGEKGWMLLFWTCLKPFWDDFKFLNFQQLLDSWKFRWISRNFQKFWNWRQRNFIFRGFYTDEYLSNLHEKLTVKKVKSYSFRPVWQPLRRTLCAGPVSQNNIYGRIFVGFGWKVDGQRGQSRYSLTCLIWLIKCLFVHVWDLGVSQAARNVSQALSEYPRQPLVFCLFGRETNRVCSEISVRKTLNMIEYLSDMNEKRLVRKVTFCSFGPITLIIVKFYEIITKELT